MRTRSGFVVFLLLLFAAVPAAHAQTLFAGEPVPLTPVRYATPGWGVPQLVATSEATFLFWNREGTLRVERIGASARLGRAILNDVDGRGFSVAWTGSHFLVVAELFDGRTHRLVSRVVDADGVARRGTVVLASNILYGESGMAFNGTHALALYSAFKERHIESYSLLLDSGGQAADAPQVLDIPYSNKVDVTATATGFAAVVQAWGSSEGVVVTFDGHGRVATQNSAGPRRLAFDGVIATNGRQSMVLSIQAELGRSGVLLEPVDESGRLGAGVILEFGETSFFHPELVWSGSEWIAAYSSIREGQRVHVVHIDAGGQRILEREVTRGTDATLVARDGQTLAAFTDENQRTVVSPLPLETGTRSLSVVAPEQLLLATASSADAVLVVWSEGAPLYTGVLYAGVLRRDGTWIERQIRGTHTRVVAGSDGQEFVVVLESSPSIAVRLDAELRQLGDPIPVRKFPSAIARIATWVGVDPQGNIEPLFSPLGPVWKATRVREQYVQHPSIAASGDGFYVVWSEAHDPLIRCDFTTCVFEDSTALVGAHVSADLRVIEKPAILAEGRAYQPNVVWSGSEYVAVWNDEQGIKVARIGREAGSKPAISEFRGDGSVSHVAATGNSAAVLWRTLDPEPVDRVLFAGAAVEVGRDLHLNTLPLLATLPDGELAFLYTAAENDAPFHGAHRLMMRVLATSPQRPPAAPRASGRSLGPHLATVEWTPPPEPVVGYSIEAHDGDGIWRELDRVNTTRFTLAIPDTFIALRVRAWNNAGAGAYSEPVVFNAGRRRAAR